MTLARALALLVLTSLLACGGGRRASPNEPSARAASSSGPSFRQMLTPYDAPKSPEQLAAIARFIRRWETDPFIDVPENDTGQSTMFAMFAWLTGSPDVSVMITNVLADAAEGRGEVSAMVPTGSAFGMAAYLIEHPGTPSGEPEVQVAGVEFSLHWYEAGLRRGDAHNTFFDELLAIRASSGHAGLLAWWNEHVRM